MLNRKNCKICDSPWHSKNKCPKRENKPLKAVYKLKADIVPLSPQNASNRPRIAHKGKSERSLLTAEADRVFSIHIRQRGMNWFGNNLCYTCSADMPWGQLQCGHFISRRFSNVRWNELNCWPQCNDCNVEKHGNLKVYEAKLRREFGDDAVDGLKQLSLTNDKVQLEAIQTVIDKYNVVVF